MSLSTISNEKSIEDTKKSVLPKAFLHVAVVLGVASLLSSCGALDPYGYAYPQAEGNYSRGVVTQQNGYAAPQTNYGQIPHNRSNSIQDQTRSYQEEAARIASYNNAVQSKAQEIRAAIPPQLQNQNTYNITLMQARSLIPQNLSAQDYQDISRLNQAKANLTRQRLSSFPIPVIPIPRW